MRDNTKKSKKILWLIILIIAALVCALAVTYIVMYFSSGKLPKDYKKSPAQTTASSKVSTGDADTTSLADNPYDWDKLQATNTDIYAYIVIPGTDIDLPVAQPGKSRDDSFYLTHNETGEYEFAGCIYSEKQNATDFTDPVTVLYGHNMLNGTMFAQLHKFEDADFFNKHQYMYIYTPGHKLTYEIYSAYVYDDRHILNSFDFSNKKVRMKYFNSTLAPNSMTYNVREGITLKKKNKILTLSTCTKNSDNTRYLVNGILVSNEVSE